MTRRDFFRLPSMTLGAAALSSLMAEDQSPGVLPHFAPTAKRVIYLFQHGAPSQLDLFDYKPALAARRGEDLPDSIRQGQRLTGMTAFQSKFPTAPSIFPFAQHGQSGLWLSELLPHTGEIADDICVIRSMRTEPINHDPAVTFFQTGFQLAGRPSIGSWISYGLGTENKDLPAFIVEIFFNPVDEAVANGEEFPVDAGAVRFEHGGERIMGRIVEHARSGLTRG